MNRRQGIPAGTGFKSPLPFRELSELLHWKRGGLLDPFSLQQVPALVPPHDLQACADCEAQQRNERIRKSNAIDVVGTRPADQIACDLVAPEKQVEHSRVDVL